MQDELVGVAGRGSRADPGGRPKEVSFRQFNLVFILVKLKCLLNNV